MDLRLAVPAVCAWIAAAVLIGLPSVPPWAIIGIWAAAGAAIATRRRPLAALGVCLAVVALVSSMVGVRAGERHPAYLVEAAASSRHLSIDAKVTATVLPGSDHFAATATGVTVGSTRHTGSVPVLVFATPSTRIGIGSTISIDGTVRTAEPGDDVAFLVFARGSPRVLASPPPVLAWSDALRQRFADAATALPGDGGHLLPGLAIGDTSAVGDDLDAAMKASSLSHLTAVSGANCAVVVGLAMLAGRALGIRRRWRVVASIAVLVGFVMLVTPEPSVLRAAVMALLVLVAALLGRTTRGVPLVAAAVLGLVVYDPWLARNYGFVLSVLATAALIVLAEPLARVLRRWLPPALAMIIAVPLAAQLACQPVLILLNPTLPLYGIAANLLAEPAAPVATVLGLAACAVLPALPGLGTVLAWVAWPSAAWIAAVARFFSVLPGHAVAWLVGMPGLAVLAVVTAAIVALLLGRTPRVRRIAASVCVLVLVGTGAAVLGTHVTQRLSRPPDWQIAACDVGQGDAFLVRSEGKVAEIDTGRDPAPIAACLAELHVTHLDLLVLTHYDLDHVGGSPAVEGLADRVLVGPVAEPKDQRLRDDFAAAGALVEPASRGMTGTLGNLDWTVLWPPTHPVGLDPGNDSSVTVYFDCPKGGCLTSLFLGDLGEDSQDRLLAAGPLPRVDVVKVAHHGSADQEPRLYSEVAATVGAIGVGLDNDYGHPTQKLLDILTASGTDVVRTDLDGLCLLSPGSSPGTVSVWTQRDGGGG